MELWGFNLTRSGYPQIFSAPSGETMRQTPDVSEVQNVLEVLYHYAKFGRARISPAAGAAKNVEFFVCPSSFVVRHAFSVSRAFECQRLFARFHHEDVGVQN